MADAVLADAAHVEQLARRSTEARVSPPPLALLRRLLGSCARAQQENMRRQLERRVAAKMEVLRALEARVDLAEQHAAQAEAAANRPSPPAASSPPPAAKMGSLDGGSVPAAPPAAAPTAADGERRHRLLGLSHLSQAKSFQHEFFHHRRTGSAGAAAAAAPEQP